MSFLLIGGQVINLMCVSLVTYEPGDEHLNPLLKVHLIGVDEPGHYWGDDADAAWAAFKKMATPLERL